MQEQFSRPRGIPQIQCEKCHLPAGPDMIECPERVHGNCPYRVSSKAVVPNSLKAVLALTVLISIVLLGTAWNSTDAWARFALIMFIAVIVAYVGSDREITLYNKKSGVFWQRRASRLGNHVFTLRAAEALKPVDPNLADFPMPRYPASVTAVLPGPALGASQAAFVIKATLLNMLAQGVIMAWYADIFEERANGQSIPSQEFVLLPGNRIAEGTQGALETHIASIVANPNSSSGSRRYYDLGLPLPGISVYEVVYRLYPDDKRDPGGWFNSKAMDDAIRAGFGVARPSMHGRQFVRHEKYATDLEEDRHRIVTWLKNKSKDLPKKFRFALDEEILKAIADHIQKDEGAV